MKHIALSLIIGLVSIACGGIGSSGPESLKLKYPGTESQDMPVKSGGFYVSTKTWTKPDQRSTSSAHFICVGDHEVDTSRGSISLGKKVEDGQTKVCFSLDGAEDTDNESLAKTGTYPMGKIGQGFAFNSVSSASIRVFKDGKEVRNSFNPRKTQGEITITSATADSISGEINLSDGENEIKGNFSAKAKKQE